MTRLLGIDYGRKRVGLALSDPLGIFASGLGTIENKSLKQLLRDVAAVITQHNVSKVVIGLPLRTTGETGEAAEAVQNFGELLAQATGVNVIYEDERFTSVIAQQSLREQGVEPSRKKHLVDQTAAALILQQYMDKLANRE